MKSAGLHHRHSKAATVVVDTNAHQSASAADVSFLFTSHLMHCMMQLSFDAGPHGKPQLVPKSAAAAAQRIAGQLQFNLSHTTSLIGGFKSPT